MQIEIQRANMVRNQIRPVGVEDTNVTNAMLKIPRHVFIAQKLSSVAYTSVSFNKDKSKPFGTRKNFK
jgi:protein-L-isoaspartate O-methyltransferase